MSERAEMLPKEYCLELSKLCSESKPLEFDVVKNIVERELDGSIYELFNSFDMKPLGPASIGQVHKAVLKDGRKVVIKVQRPNIDVVMRQDIMLFKTIIKPIKFAPSVGTIDLNEVLEDLWKITQQELNFFVEAINTIKFKEVSDKYEGISCPEIVRKYITQKVLTMEFIDGFSIDNELKLEEYEINRKKITKKLANNFISQVLKEEFFHADPHKGNIMIRMTEKENSKGEIKKVPEIVWIDFGMIKKVNPA